MVDLDLGLVRDEQVQLQAQDDSLEQRTGGAAVSEQGAVVDDGAGAGRAAVSEEGQVLLREGFGCAAKLEGGGSLDVPGFTGFARPSVPQPFSLQVGAGTGVHEVVSAETARRGAEALVVIGSSLARIASSVESLGACLPEVVSAFARSHQVGSILSGMINNPKWMDARMYKQLATELPVIIEGVMEEYEKRLKDKLPAETKPPAE